jgi:hypothetical protein
VKAGLEKTVELMMAALFLIAGDVWAHEPGFRRWKDLWGREPLYSGTIWAYDHCVVTVPRVCGEPA